MATTYLSRTPGSTGNRRTWTLSLWFKKSRIRGTGAEKLFSANDGTDFSTLYFNNDSLKYYDYVSGNVNDVETTRVFRDVNAWYHIVFRYDSTQAASGDRIRIYVNGVEETAFSVESQPALNYDSFVNNSGYPNYIGAQDSSSGTAMFDGLMTHVQLVDGLSLAPTEFGQVDATSGIWKIKPGCYATPGTNGFCLKMETTTGSAMGTDSSGEGNNFTENGSPTQAIDNPSNVLCTVNSLDNYIFDGTFSNGNTTVATASGGGSSYTYSTSTFGVSTGKWYWETKYVSKTGGYKYPMIGISSFQSTANSQELGHHEHDWGYLMDNTDSKLRNNDASISWGDNFTEGDIIGVGLDLDNNKLYFAVNGTWVNSGVPTSGATGTGAISITAPASTPKGAYFASVCYWDGTYGGTFDNNFGNGYFGTTQVSSAGTSSTDDDSIWEYDCPTGYYGLNTNNRNTYG